MNDRQRILDKLPPAQQPDTPAPQVGGVPATASDRETRFREAAQNNNCSVEKLPNPQAIPRWLAAYVRQHKLVGHCISAHDRLRELPWHDHDLQCSNNLPGADGALALSWADCAIAESGTVLLAADASNPPALNFLPDHHIVVVQCGDVAASWDAAWQYCRKRWRATNWPRGLYFISGPSSTADVALTQVFGAHGPRHLTFLLLSESTLE